MRGIHADFFFYQTSANPASHLRGDTFTHDLHLRLFDDLTTQPDTREKEEEKTLKKTHQTSLGQPKPLPMTTFKTSGLGTYGLLWVIGADPARIKWTQNSNVTTHHVHKTYTRNFPKGANIRYIPFYRSIYWTP